MAQSSLLVQTDEAPRRGLILIGVGIGALLLLYMVNGGSYIPALAIAAVAAGFGVYKVAAYTRLDRGWLIVPLVLTSILIMLFYLEGAPRAALHYGLMGVFCIPCILPAWRSGIFRRGGFKLYALYFVWALITVAWSLAPQYSIDPTTKKLGGNEVGVRTGTLTPLLNAAVFAAKVGVLSQPIQTPFGYYVFTVDKITPQVVQTLKQATPQIKTTIAAQQENKAEQALATSFNKKWIARTTCASGYVWSGYCSNAPKTSSTSSTTSTPTVTSPSTGSTGATG